jgi:hypothetical protein
VVALCPEFQDFVQVIGEVSNGQCRHDCIVTAV